MSSQALSDGLFGDKGKDVIRNVVLDYVSEEYSNGRTDTCNVVVMLKNLKQVLTLFSDERRRLIRNKKRK